MRIKELRVGQKSTWKTLVGITHSVLALKKMANSLGLLFSQIGQKMIFMSTLLQQIKAGGKGVTYPFYLIIRGVRAVVSGFLALLEYLMKKLKNLTELYSYCKELDLNVIGLMCIPPFEEDSEKFVLLSVPISIESDYSLK